MDQPTNSTTDEELEEIGANIFRVFFTAFLAGGEFFTSYIEAGEQQAAVKTMHDQYQRGSAARAQGSPCFAFMPDAWRLGWMVGSPRA